MTRMPNSVLTEQQYNIAAEWWRQGSAKAAAAALGLSEQTVKNTLLTARRKMGVTTTVELVKAIWKDLPEPADQTIDPNEYRRLRYQFDPVYREKAKKWAREGMRRRRQAEVNERRLAFERLMVEQDGKCAICGGEDRLRRTVDGQAIRLSVDHDHVTGQIRQLLCTGCNMMLGLAGDRPEILEAGARYLRRHADSVSHNASARKPEHGSEAA